MEKKRLMFMVVVFTVACHVFADRYKVLYVNSTGIKIDKNNVVVGSIFSDKDNIVWTDNQQAMKVINMNTNRIIVLVAKALKKKKSTSLYEYLTSTKHLSTRDIKKTNTLEEWKIDSTLYLLDTLKICRPQMRGNLVVASIVNEKGKTIDLPISNDGKTYILTRSIFCDQVPYPSIFTIKEFDKEKNWEYVVYRRLIIEPVNIDTEAKSEPDSQEDAMK